VEHKHTVSIPKEYLYNLRQHFDAKHLAFFLTKLNKPAQQNLLTNNNLI